LDLYKTIRDLLDERKRLDAIIARLEGVQRIERERSTQQPPKRRGRKKMSEAERKEVSERMRKYWEGRRKSAQKESANGSESSARTGT